MQKILDVEKDLNKIAEILVYSKQLTYDSYFMLVTKTSTKFNIISRDKFLQRIQKSFWILAIIELSKLFGPIEGNDKFSIILLIDNLKNAHSNSEWTNLITDKELEKINSEFNTSEMKIHIKNLRELRNQHFAHADKNPKNHIHDIKFYFDNSIFLIEKLEKIITFLSEKLLNKPITFHNYKGEEMDSFFDKHINYIEGLSN